MTSHHIGGAAFARFLRRRKGESSLRQRRRGEAGSLDRDKELQSRDLLGVGGRMNRRGRGHGVVMLHRMAAEMGVDADRVVVTVVVVLEMGMDQRSAERAHLDGDAQTPRDDPTKHRGILPAYQGGVKDPDGFLNSRSDGRGMSQCCIPMRTLHWLFVVSVLLFISGIGFVIAGARTARVAEPADAPVTTPVATVKQIMNGIVQPNAMTVYGAVATFINADGVKEVAPQNAEEWAVVGNSAAALVESGNLLLMGDRAIDNADWVTMTRAFMDAATKALHATEAGDKDGILTTGSELNDTCDTCHAKYQRQ